MDLETKQVINIADVLSHQFENRKGWQEVRLTDTFADLVKYGEWMPVEGEK
jgi:hypothetical protein